MKTLLAACAASFVLVPALASAHAGISPASVANGSTAKLAISIPHGCDGAATDTVIIELPEGFVGAKPMAKPGWQIDTETGDYQKSYSLHGSDRSSGVTKVTFSGGSLPDDLFDEFIVRGSLMGFETETSLPFKVTQLCGDASVSWSDVAGEGEDPHSLPHPAPVLTVTAAAMASGHEHGHDHGGGHDHAAMASDTVTLGALELSGAFSRATAPNAPVAGGYVTITNTGDTADRLIAASSPAAAQVQLHEMKMEGDVMKMAELEDGIPVPAGATVTLAPGGLHLMLMGLESQLVEGQSVPVTLTFEEAGTVEISLDIGSPAAQAPAGHDGMTMDHDAMQHGD